MEDVQTRRQAELAKLLQRWPADDPEEHLNFLNPDGTLPRYAVVSLYEGRRNDGSYVEFAEADQLQAQIEGSLESLEDHGWYPTVVVDLNDGSEQRVTLSGFTLEPATKPVLPQVDAPAAASPAAGGVEADGPAL